MSEHPVVVIGAGPIGLAAAAHLTETGSDVVVLERGVFCGFRCRAMESRPPVLPVV